MTLNTATNRSSPQADLSLLRALAEAGRDTPLIGGPYLVLWGGAFAVGSMLIGLAQLGLMAWPSFDMVIAAAIVIAAVVTVGQFVLMRRHRQQVANTSNRVMGVYWTAAGWAIFMYFVGCQLVAWRTDSLDILNSIGLVVLALYAVGWWLTAEMAQQGWMKGVTAATVVSFVIVAAAVGSSWHAMAYTIALLISAVLPGLEMMRRARQIRTETAV